MPDQDKEGNGSLGAFIVGIILGATVMFFACRHFWELKQTSFRTAQECGHAALACEQAATLAKGCP